MASQLQILLLSSSGCSVVAKEATLPTVYGVDAPASVALEEIKEEEEE